VLLDEYPLRLEQDFPYTQFVVVPVPLQYGNHGKCVLLSHLCVVRPFPIELFALFLGLAEPANLDPRELTRAALCPVPIGKPVTNYIIITSQEKALRIPGLDFAAYCLKS